MSDDGGSGPVADELLSELTRMRGEIAELRSESQLQRKEIAQLRADARAERSSSIGPAEDGECAESGASPRSFLSRRGLLLGGIGAVAGATGLELAAAGPAAAATGNMQFGADNQAVAAATGLFSTASTWTSLVRNTGTGIGVIGTASSGVGVQGESSGAWEAAGVRGKGTSQATGVMGHSVSGDGVSGTTESRFAAGVRGVGAAQGYGIIGSVGGYNDVDACGVLGVTDAGVGVRGSCPAGTGVVASSTEGTALHATCSTGPGITAFSAQAEVMRLASGSAELNLLRTYEVGAVFVTSGGEVWYCVEDGTPGKWRLLASPASAGAFVPITPVRVYDSRWSGVPGVTTGTLVSGDKRPVSVAAARSNVGAVLDANAIPAGATALTVNLTITATQGSGNLALVPGGVLTSATSSINWTSPGQALANGLTVPIRASDRTVNLLCNGTATQAVLDVTGYFLGK